ncbi:hypothetical protein HQ29_07210 [Porphyromonas canoris]|uniref:virulence factor SrfB n=1 Tax=Porphyromonas canoris TaxID=36875 RepID=UPI00051CE6B2|nr:virulence factor SrfB [Porphyromonas canoris]KGL51762.1 hypothetical protein HQ29_07210 [Porphyromonas canoris]
MGKINILIANTGIQFLRIPNIVIDINNPIKKLSFLECEIDEGEYMLDQVYYFSNEDLYLSKSDLQYYYGLTDYELFSLMSLPDNPLNVEALRGMGKNPETLININSLEAGVRYLRGDKDRPLDVILNTWLPIPMYEDQGLSDCEGPSNWARIKLIPKRQERQKLTLDFLIAIDTDTTGRNSAEAPIDFLEPSRMYSLCGMSAEVLAQLDDNERAKMTRFVVPNIIFQYWCHTATWSADRLMQIFHDERFDISRLPEGKRMSFAAYYMYLLNTIYQLDVLPRIKFCSAKNEPININLILDVGNSRSFGLLAEDPLDESFSRAKNLELTELNNGRITDKPFDMRLAFRREDFGHYEYPQNKQFIWPSILSIGEEAQTYIYQDTDSYQSADASNTYHSSPKRYLWDDEIRSQQWEFARLPNDSMESRYISMAGIIPPQFLSDGRFTGDPEEGAKTCFGNFSRRSLMTFCFLEILLQANMQVNSLHFRQAHGREEYRRKIGKIILTCPTAMTKQEQVALRQAAQEAAIVLERYRQETYTILFDPKQAFGICEVIPSIRDLSLPETEAADRRTWNYDEASCSQMVYLYSELKRFLGNAREFFDLYGHHRQDIPILDTEDREQTLTIGSLDIGAGTTDLMICNYSAQGADTITPYPLYWDSFHFSGDDLMKALITQLIIEDYQITESNGYAGVITNKLRAMGESKISTLIHDFFDDASGQTCLDRKMRRDFNVQFSIPLVYKMLQMLQEGQPNQSFSFEEIFENNLPNEALLEYFYKHFGFRLEELIWVFNADYINSIVRRVFEPYLRKWSAVFNAYGCDIVLLSGRPTSLQEILNLMIRLYPVSPNRLISMNNYRVGSWYPGADSIGYFGDRKSMVAVGALISHLAEMGKLDVFKINSLYLKKQIVPTADYLGFINAKSGELTNTFLAPDVNRATVHINSLPMHIGCKQLNIPGYPARLLYKLDFNEEYIRENIVKQRGEISAAEMAEAVEEAKHRIRRRMPLRLSISRDYRENKEHILVEAISNADKEEISARNLKLSPQSIIEDNNDWLDSGRFILRIGLNK